MEMTMKSLARPSFFRVFDLLLGAANPGLKLSSWVHDGVSWERERHSFSGPKHGLSIEIATLTRPGKRGWSMMIVKEYWWIGTESKALKSLRWAKPVAGQRSDIMGWFRAQESSLDRQLTARQVPLAAGAKAAEEIELFAESSDDQS
jgi:hypothetical protein